MFVLKVFICNFFICFTDRNSLTMKYFVLVFSSIFSCMFNYACAQFNNASNEFKGILWEISKDGMSTKSYLLGTYHGGNQNLIGYSYMDSLLQYRKIIEDVDAVGIECDMNDRTGLPKEIEKIKNIIAQKYPTYALLPDSISSYLEIFEDSIEYNYVVSFIQKFKKQKFAFPFYYERLKPNFSIKILELNELFIKAMTRERNNDEFVMMDRGIYKQATEMGKRLFFMETPSAQIELKNKIDSCFVESFTLYDQAHILYGFCKAKQDSSQNESYETIIASLYKKGDLSGIHLEQINKMKRINQMMPNKEYIEANEELTNGRNRQWIPVILSNIQKESCLIAVGVLHLPGENGLISLLRKEGYTVKPI